MRTFACIPGVLIDSLGDSWVAYSPASGASHVLNDSSVSILDALETAGIASSADLASTMARDCEQSQAEIDALLHDHWDVLIGAGLIREVLPVG